MRSIDRILFNKERMAFNHFEQSKLGGTSNPDWGRQKEDKRLILPYEKIGKGGTVQTVDRSLLVLLELGRMLRKINKAKNSQNCMHCIMQSKNLSLCTQIEILRKNQIHLLLKSLGKLSIGHLLQTRHKLHKFLDNKRLFKHVQYILNNKCEDSKFKGAFENLLVEFKETKVEAQTAKTNKFSKQYFSFKSKDKKKSKSILKSINKMKKKIFKKSPGEFKKVCKTRARIAKPKKQKITSKSGNEMITSKLVKWYMLHLMKTLRSNPEETRGDKCDNFFQSLYLGKFERVKVIPIDCRYKYEFEGGHVKGAFNICDPLVLTKLFFKHSWMHTREFLDFIDRFRDSHIDKKMAEKILYEYEIMLLKKQNKKIDLKMKRIQTRSKAGQAESQAPQKQNLFMSFSRQTSNQKLDNVFYNSTNAKVDQVLGDENLSFNFFENHCAYSQESKKQLFDSQRLLNSNLSSSRNHPRPIKATNLETFNDSKLEGNKMNLHKSQSERNLEISSIKQIMKRKQIFESSCNQLDPLLNSLLSSDNSKYSQQSIKRGENIFGLSKKDSTTKSKKFENNKSSREGEGVIFVFYCEFSSVRARKMYNFFRFHDRINNHHYKRNFPNIFLLKGGYEGFHRDFKYFCTEPKNCQLELSNMTFSVFSSLIGSKKINKKEKLNDPLKCVLNFKLGSENADYNSQQNKSFKKKKRQKKISNQKMKFLPKLNFKNIFYEKMASRTKTNEKKLPFHKKNKSLNYSFKSNLLRISNQSPESRSYFISKDKKHKTRTSNKSEFKIEFKKPRNPKMSMDFKFGFSKLLHKSRVSFKNKKDKVPVFSRVKQTREAKAKKMRSIFDALGKKQLPIKIRFKKPKQFDKSPFAKLKNPFRPRIKTFRTQKSNVNFFSTFKKCSDDEMRSPSVRKKKHSMRQRLMAKSLNLKLKDSISSGLEKSIKEANRKIRLEKAKKKIFESLDRYTKMDNEMYEEEYISAKKEYTISWAIANEEIKKKKAHRILSL